MSELLTGVSYTLRNDAEFTGIARDSRKVKKGDVFFCVSGYVKDGHNFAQDAVNLGAVALVVERWLPIDLPQVLVPSVREAMAVAACNFYDHPSKKLKMVAVGGTKGKTTAAHMIRSACQSCGKKVGLLGSLGRMVGEKLIPADLNSPEAFDLQFLLKQMVDDGVEICVMEVSAHGLDLHRVDGITYDVAVMSNFTQDHLDYFTTMEKYAEAKKKLFTKERCRHAVINMDGDRALWFIDGFGGDITTFAISHPSDVHANDIEVAEDGLNFKLSTPDEVLPVKLHMTGLFNVYNALAAAAACRALNLPLRDAMRGICDLRVVPGRMERLNTGTPYTVVLDYAHTPDALSNILTAVRQFARGRVIALFGCGGDRDRTKRPIMGKVAGEMADYVILTSDNPRRENPMDIIFQIEEGIKPTETPYEIIENRRDAIAHALDMAKQGDVVLLAGKGHETYQEIGDEKRPFDERLVVEELLASPKA